MIEAAKIIEKHKLPNGLTLEFHDFSRNVAADRWLVGFIARVPIKVQRKDFNQFENPDTVYEKFLNENGETINFDLKRERNFIDANEKDEIFSQLLNKLKDNMLGYMGHDNFADGVKKQVLKDFEERLHWYPDEN